MLLKKAEYLVNLVNMGEMGHKCAWYFLLEKDESISCGRFMIKTISSKPFEGKSEEVIERVLEVTDEYNKFDSKTVTQYHFHSWKDQDIPDGGHEAPIKVMEVVNKSEVGVDTVSIFEFSSWPLSWMCCGTCDS